MENSGGRKTAVPEKQRRQKNSGYGKGRENRYDRETGE